MPFEIYLLSALEMINDAGTLGRCRKEGAFLVYILNFLQTISLQKGHLGVFPFYG